MTQYFNILFRRKRSSLFANCIQSRLNLVHGNLFRKLEFRSRGLLLDNLHLTRTLFGLNDSLSVIFSLLTISVNVCRQRDLVRRRHCCCYCCSVHLRRTLPTNVRSQYLHRFEGKDTFRPTKFRQSSRCRSGKTSKGLGPINK